MQFSCSFCSIFEHIIDMIQCFADLFDGLDVIAAFGYRNDIFLDRIRNAVIVYDNVSVWQYMSLQLFFWLVLLTKDFLCLFRLGNHLVDFQQRLCKAHARIRIDCVIFDGKRKLFYGIRDSVIVDCDVAQCCQPSQ